MVIKEDIALYNDRVKSRGFLYAVGFILTLSASLLKISVMVCHDIHHVKNKEETAMTNLFKEQYKNHISPLEKTKLLMGVGLNTSIADFNKKKVNFSNATKAKALAKLRNYFLVNNVLKGEIIKTKFPRIPYEDIYNSCEHGTEWKPCIVQHITFGKDINKSIHEAFGYKLKKGKLTKETYLIFNDGETYDLERTLKDTYYNDKIELKLENKENNLTTCNEKIIIKKKRRT